MGGLFALQNGMKEREVAVFFRNNHFSTVFKFEDKTHLLVTDSGYRDVPECAWECVTDTHGDNQFVAGFTSEKDAMAAMAAAQEGAQQDPESLLHHQLQEENDYALALQMQQQEQRQQAEAQARMEAQIEAQRAEQLRLEEEHRRRQLMQQQQQQQA